MNIQGIRVATIKIEAEKARSWRTAIRNTSAKIQAGVAPSDFDFESSDAVLHDAAELVKGDLDKVGYKPDRGDNIGLHFPTLSPDEVVVFMIPGGIYSPEELETLQGQGKKS